MTTSAGTAPDTLSLELAERLARAAIEHAVSIGLRITVVVADAAGFPVLVTRMDGAPRMTVGVATSKAHTAAAYEVETAFLGELQQEIPELLVTVRAAGVGGPGAAPVTALPGGLPLRTAASRVIGAVAVSGGTAEQDVIVARAALAAVLG